MEQNRYIPGDWVKHRGKLAKVLETYKTNYFVKVCHHDYNPEIEYDDAYFSVEARPQDIEPILLTFEILKKIGWELREHHKKEYYEDVEWYEFLNRPVTYISLRFYPEEEAFSPFLYREEISEKPIQYVHQLQHLLFGLGLDSNFELKDIPN